jgi:hypothetical protein
MCNLLPKYDAVPMWLVIPMRLFCFSCMLLTQVGIDSGDHQHYFVHQFSSPANTSRMFKESNFNHAGRWMYRINGLTVQQPSCFYPGSWKVHDLAKQYTWGWSEVPFKKMLLILFYLRMQGWLKRGFISRISVFRKSSEQLHKPCFCQQNTLCDALYHQDYFESSPNNFGHVQLNGAGIEITASQTQPEQEIVKK